ncbi:organic cation transporter 1-like isoform X2 [Macrobrachium nipponense]|uniref:organic cation transporter 1-like isoform X2 n=1 Tax=Macrobrachium nipponense TaxID=159736 RepID=UPI0030C87D9F
MDHKGTDSTTKPKMDDGVDGKNSRAGDGFDSLLEIVGSRGRYQHKLVYYVLSPICFFLGYSTCQLLFQVAVPDHWCHVPGRENTTLSEKEWMDLTIPRISNTTQYSQCSRYSLKWTEEANSTFEISGETERCGDGWDFDQGQFWATVASTNGWVCEQGSAHNILTINIAGNAVGTFIFPMLADRVGRRPIFYALLTNHLVFTLAYIWMPIYSLHMIFRFLRGFIELTIYLIPHITVMEVLDPEDRAKATTIGWVFWIIGMCVTSLIAWIIPHWQYLAMSSLVAPAFGFLYWNHLPESPRWLLSKGRLDECTEMMRKISEINGQKDISRGDLEKLILDLNDQNEKEVSFMKVFNYSKLRLRSSMIFILSPCLYLVYGITMFGINVLPDNQFLSHFILSASELPSNGLGLVLLHYTGRRMTCYITFITTAIWCVAALFCTHNQWLMVVTLALIKFFITTALLVMYVITAEIFPTPVRSSGLGIMGLTGLVAMAMAPSVLNAGLGPTFQYWVMLGLLGVSLLTSLALPETLGLPLPQTFQEAENIGKGRPLTTWVHHWNQHKYPGRKHSKVDLAVSSEEINKLTAVS